VQPAEGARRFEFSVADTGIGMGKEAMHRLFEAFRQGESDTTRRFGGTGLGLAISQRLAMAMGGGIRAESEEGNGSVFILDLPLPQATPPAPDRPGPEGIAGIPYPGLRALIVEDNPTNRIIARKLLSKLGVESDFAEDGSVGVNMAFVKAYDIILMDCQMPVMDGFEATREIRKRESAGGGRRTIIAMTANAFPEDRRLCSDAGMDGFLAKPVLLPALQEAIDHHTARIRDARGIGIGGEA
jgi:CheY-like chemotaxis protein